VAAAVSAAKKQAGDSKQIIAGGTPATTAQIVASLAPKE